MKVRNCSKKYCCYPVTIHYLKRCVFSCFLKMARDVCVFILFSKLFRGNWNALGHATHLFSRDIIAQHIRILPITKYGTYAVLRLEILGCKGNIRRTIERSQIDWLWWRFTWKDAILKINCVPIVKYWMANQYRYIRPWKPSVQNMALFWITRVQCIG